MVAARYADLSQPLLMTSFQPSTSTANVVSARERTAKGSSYGAVGGGLMASRRTKTELDYKSRLVKIARSEGVRKMDGRRFLKMPEAGGRGEVWNNRKSPGSRSIAS